ncbi:gfo/Idh/MocA family oxidoreductase, partial [Pirellulales bacterium]|nr:gfo/Idh/MocA family oxidoreductase [Pirellulales bacterium]
KPMAASLADVIAIYDAAKHYDCPIFSTSALRYGQGTLEVQGGSIGPVLGCDIFCPCSLEKTHPDFFWYGIHGVEALFTVMGTGCQSVSRTQTADGELAVGVWNEGRIGTVRGMRAGVQQYGGLAFGAKANQTVGSYRGYEPLVHDIVKFFRSGDPPTTEQETIEIFAFMEAADESKRRNGAVITIPEYIEQSRDKAARKRTW